jgi:membrane associated rhomboid family serine protease
MTRRSYVQKAPWTCLEVVIGALTVGVMFIAGVLLAANGTGSWAPLIGSVLGVVLGLLRYRAERKMASLDADDQDE